MQPCLNCIRAKCPEQCVFGTEPKSDLSPSSSSSVPQEWNESGELPKSDDSAYKLSETLASATKSISTRNTRIVVSNDFLIGINPVVRSTDVLNIHMDLSAFRKISSTSQALSPSSTRFKCIRNSTRIIGLMEISQQEPGAQLFWNLNENQKKLKLLTIQNFPDHLFRAKLQEETRQTFGNKYIDIFTYGLSNASSNYVLRRQFAEYGSTIGLSYSPDFNFHEGDSYSAALVSLLPLRPALFAYVDRFFQKIYPAFPVVDQEWLLIHIDKLLVYSPDGASLLEVSISNKDELMILAILLFMLRLSYLSFLTNLSGRNVEILNATQEWGLTLARSEISLSVVELGTRLLTSSRYHKKPLLLIFQAHLLLAITKMYALENDTSFNVQDPDCNMGQLVHMATTLNLDRDPDFVRENHSPDGRMKNLRRKLWYVVIHLDYLISYMFLSPRCIMLAQHNTKPPEYSPNNSNINDQRVEEEAIRLIKSLHEIVSGGSDLLDICLDLRNSHRAIDVISKLNDFEIFINERLGSIPSYIEDVASRAYSTYPLIVFQMQTLVVLKLFLANVYYFLHLFYSYQREVELDYFFFKKLILIVFNEMNYFCPELMFSKYAIADPIFNVFLTPAILIYLHVVAAVGVGLILRVHCTILLMEGDDPNEDELKMAKDLEARTKTFTTRKLKLCKLLSERYFYGWKCSKVNGLGRRIIFDKETYSGKVEAVTNAKVLWSVPHQLEIFNLVPVTEPIQFQDVGDVRQHCYWSSRIIVDSELKGLDLLKTIQTDNFWITFNAISEQDPYAAIFAKGKELQPEAPETLPGVGSVVNYEHSLPLLRGLTPGPDLRRSVHPSSYLPGAVTPRTEIPAPGLESDFPELMGPPSYDSIDLNFFGTDWTIDDFYPLN